MSLQRFWSSKGFSTVITFVIYLSFIECLDVSLQMSCSSEGFSTRITFEIVLTFVECLDMFLQISWCSEGFSTRITFVIALSFMCLFRTPDWVKDFSQKSHLKNFECRIFEEKPTKVIFWAFLVIFIKMQNQSILSFKYSVAYIAYEIFLLLHEHF